MADGKGGSIGDLATGLGNLLIPQTMANMKTLGNASSDRAAYADAADQLRQLINTQSAPPTLRDAPAQRKPFDITSFNDDGSTTSNPMAAGPQTNFASLSSLPLTPFNKFVGGSFNKADAPQAAMQFADTQSGLKNGILDSMMKSPTFAKTQLDTMAAQQRMAPFLANMPYYVINSAPLGSDALKDALQTYYKSQAPQQVAAGASLTGPGPGGKQTTLYTAPERDPDELRLVKGLQTEIDKFGPGTPEAKPYEEALAAKNIAVTNAKENERHDRVTEAQGKYEMKIDPFGNQQVFDKGTGKVVTDPSELSSAVPKMVDSQAQLISEYRKRPVTGIGSTRGLGAMIMAKVAELNPQYDETQYDIKDKARKDFATGKQGESVKSGNVALSHVMLLEQLGDALNNGNVALANKIKNKLSDEFGGVPIASYEAVAPMVGDEVAKYILGGQTAVTDRQEFAKPLTSARGTEARTGALNGMKSAMVGRLRGNKQQYEFNTGLKDFGDMLFPEVSSLLDNPKYQEGVNPNSPPAAPSMKLTDDPAGKAAYDALPPNSKYIDPTGVERTKK